MKKNFGIVALALFDGCGLVNEEKLVIDFIDDYLYFNEDGSIQKIQQTTEGVKPAQ